MSGGVSDGLERRLRAAGLDPAASGPWETWLRLRDHCGRRATLVDLYELEAASRGIEPEKLPESDRARLKAAARPVAYPHREPVVPGSDRSGDPHQVVEYDPAWPVRFADWRSRLAAAMGATTPRIDHIGSTAVGGLAAKPVVDILVSVPDVRDEAGYLPACISAGLILRVREAGHLLLWPPSAAPRDVHVHVCDASGEWGRRQLLFRDYLRAHPETCAEYSALKRELISRWRNDRKAYTEAKTGFVLDTLDAAEIWARTTGWIGLPAVP